MFAIGICLGQQLAVHIIVIVAYTIDKKRYLFTNADMFIGIIYRFYTLFNILMLFEHSLRHLDDFGFEHNQWLYENARILWKNHALIKLPLNYIMEKM